MRKIVDYFCLLPLLLGCGLFAFAQEDQKPQDVAKPQENSKVQTTPAHYYHVDFVVQELGSDGKAINSRSYTTTVNTGSHEFISIRASSRIPVLVEASQYQFVEVGINIDARDAQEIGRQLALNLTADVSSIAATADQSLHRPVVRQNKWQAAVLIPVGKPTVVFTSDALESKGSMQLVVTATPLQ
jgi:hypothetical protein